MIGYGFDWDGDVVEIEMPAFDAYVTRRLMVDQWCPWTRGMHRVEVYRKFYGFVPRRKDGLRDLIAA